MPTARSPAAYRDLGQTPPRGSCIGFRILELLGVKLWYIFSIMTSKCPGIYRSSQPWSGVLDVINGLTDGADGLIDTECRPGCPAVPDPTRLAVFLPPALLLCFFVSISASASAGHRLVERKNCICHLSLERLWTLRCRRIEWTRSQRVKQSYNIKPSMIP